jgi:hypothetical protein
MTLHTRSSDPAALLDFPYASQRMPLLAANVVSTSQPLAASAGLRMLARGGNAVDAALATAIALAVVEPCQNGIGSDTFAIIWADGKLHGLNASGRAPHKLTPKHFAGRDAMPMRGWDSVTVPGTVSAWRVLSERFGKLPFADLFEPAIRYATDGYLVSPTVHRQWQAQVETLIVQPGFREAFAPQGRAPRPGERWICPGQAHTLQRIAETKGEAFYHGELAAAMVAHARATGGVIDESDLAAHQPDWVAPISMTYRDLKLHEIGPNGQGIAALMALGMLDNFDLAASGLDSVQTLHLQLEAMKLAFADLNEYVGDVDYMKRVRANDLLDRDYLKKRAKLIDPKRASAPKAGAPNSSGTVYLTAGRRRAEHRHRAAESRLRIHVEGRPSQSGRPGQASVPHHHPGFPHEGRPAADELWRDGRLDAGAGTFADHLAHRRLRTESAKRERRAALAHQRRTRRRQCRMEFPAELDRWAASTRPQDQCREALRHRVRLRAARAENRRRVHRRLRPPQGWLSGWTLKRDHRRRARH